MRDRAGFNGGVGEKPRFKGSAGDLGAESIQEAMIEGVVHRIRQNLRAQIMAAIQPDIDAAIDDAVATLDLSIRSFLEPEKMGVVVQLLVRKPGE